MGHKGSEHESVFFLGRGGEGREEDKMSRSERKEERESSAIICNLVPRGLAKKS